MNELHLPWLELLITVPALGSLWVGRIRQADVARRHCLVIGSLALVLALGAWLDLYLLDASKAHDRWDLLAGVFGEDLFIIDQVNAPLLPMAALLYLLTTFATLRTKIRRYSFGWALAGEALLLATFCCGEPWGVVLLASVGVLPPIVELRSRGKPTGVYVLHMSLFAGLLIAGWGLIQIQGPSIVSTAGVLMLTAAILIRTGAAPVHCWVTDLFEHATFGTALLFVTPMVGAFCAVRLLLPVAPEWALEGVAVLSLVTAVYASGMALVQHETRRFFCYLFLSHSSLVLVGLETATPIGLTGALCVWLSVGLALTGFGLTLRAIEARMGRLSLRNYHGLYEHVPTLASFFLLTGLASVGFPGTIGFVGSELLIEGAVGIFPYVGAAVVLAAAFNGIAIVYAYFRLFTGARHYATISLHSRLPEKIAVLILSALIVGGGLFPQLGVASRYEAAMAIARARKPVSSNASEHGDDHKVTFNAKIDGPFGLGVK